MGLDQYNINQKEKLINLLLIVFLYAIYSYIYSRYVVNIYSFGGFVEVENKRHEYAMPILMVISLAMPSRGDSSIKLISIIYFYFVLLPGAVLMSMQGSSLVFFGILILANIYLILFYLLAKMTRVDDAIKIAECIDIKLCIKYLTVFVVAILLYTGVDGGFQLRFAFKDVYEYRFDFNENLRFPLTYLLPWAAGPALSFLTVLTLSERNWLGFLGALFAGVLFYGLTTHKSFMFLTLFSAFFYIIVSRKINLNHLIGLFLGLGCILLVLSTGDLLDFIGGTFANRILFIPAQIHYAFFDEFSSIGYVYWAESKITFGQIKSPIELNSVNHIAEKMTGDSKIGANVGWVANGFMNMGVWGIVVYAAIISIILNVIDGLSEKLPSAVILSSLSASIFFLITSSDLLTSLLTGGLIPFILFLVFINKQRVKVIK